MINDNYTKEDIIKWKYLYSNRSNNLSNPSKYIEEHPEEKDCIIYGCNHPECNINKVDANTKVYGVSILESYMPLIKEHIDIKKYYA